MADVKLQDPATGYIAVVGDAGEAARLKAKGYREVDEKNTSAVLTPEQHAALQTVDKTTTKPAPKTDKPASDSK